MPHVIVKMVAGKSEEQKNLLVDDITNAVMQHLHMGRDAVSVSVEEIPQVDWMTRVYEADILPHWDSLYKKPGYGPQPAEKP